jgi:uncharacterized protein YjbI with pentapeptide repeats
MTTMPGRDWIRRHKKTVAAAALGIALLVAYGMWLDWEWKAMIGWKALIGYIDPDPDDATGKKDAVQVYAIIVAGVVAAITAAVGLLNLRLTRKNLEQQRELEAQRAQGTALQAYYEQIGKLLTEYELRTTDREEIRELARGQTFTVLQEVDGNGKRSLLTFLHGARLITGAEIPPVVLYGADLRESKLRSTNLRRANLEMVDLRKVDLQEAILQEAVLPKADLRGANLQEAILRGANLQEANLQGAILREADLLQADLQAVNLHGADLRAAKLPGADLHGADLHGANLLQADLRGANLQAARGLTQEQIERTIGSSETKLPEGLNRPQLWSKDFEEQMKILQERLRGQ